MLLQIISLYHVNAFLGPKQHIGDITGQAFEVCGIFGLLSQGNFFPEEQNELLVDVQGFAFRINVFLHKFIVEAVVERKEVVFVN